MPLQKQYEWWSQVISECTVSLIHSFFIHSLIQSCTFLLMLPHLFAPLSITYSCALSRALKQFITAVQHGHWYHDTELISLGCNDVTISIADSIAIAKSWWYRLCAVDVLNPRINNTTHNTNPFSHGVLFFIHFQQYAVNAMCEVLLPLTSGASHFSIYSKVHGF